MPKYAVVVCPNCKKPFVIEPGPKTVSCRNCNKRLDASRLNVFFSSDGLREAQNARGSIIASMAGDSEAFEEAAKSLGRDVMEHIGEGIQEQRFMEDKRKVNEKMNEEARKTKKKGQQAILIEAFDKLSENGDVSIETYREKVSCQGIGSLKFDQWVDKMIESGVAYSPRYGYLRKS